MSTRATLRELRGVGLVEACMDPSLLGAAFTPWPKQLELLELAERYRLNVWALGRRSTKTTAAAAAAAWMCLLRPELSARLRSGERGYGVCIAVNNRQARVWLEALLSLVEASPVLADLIDSVTEDEVRFATGMTAAAFPCSSRSGRGYPIHTLVLDEAAHMLTETEGFQAADRVWEALAPSTAQFAELARIIVASTPYGDAGLFSELFQRASSGELGEDAVAVQAPTVEANPTITAAFLELERARDPESFAGEYEAQFVGSGAAFLDPERIADAVADRAELLPEHARGWLAGFDASFSSDPAAVCVVGRALDGSGRLRLALARSWKPDSRKAQSFEERRLREDQLLDEVAEVLLPYHPHVIVDQYAAAAVRDRLERHGLSVEVMPLSAQSKTLAFQAVRARLNLGELELYEHTGLLAELRRLRTKYAAGAASVITPRTGGSHCDLAVALALAVQQCDRWGIARGTPWRPGEPVPAIAREADLDSAFHGSAAGSSRRRTREWYDDCGGGHGIGSMEF